MRSTPGSGGIDLTKETALLASLQAYAFNQEHDVVAGASSAPTRSRRSTISSTSSSSGRSRRPTSVRNGISKGLLFERRRGLPPILGPDPRVLILGSAPSQISLMRGEYYANPHNHFWGVLGYAMDDPEFPLLDYRARCDVLKARGIAVWDICEEFTRHRSADATLQCEEYSDIAKLLVDNPTVKRILCNGSASCNNVRKYKLEEKMQALAPSGAVEVPEIVRLPSTSPAHAVANAVETKGEAWKQQLRDLIRTD
ncbi:hypothetical protein FOZ63_028761 [Perkinsus olseni]|uniref:Uracil-DNA glycosylase-like domain-containing protein n=1 Tax=Perkinsus olseni TaxID=32597 RepID=A0A7J6QXP4_PEROL|nr:hypothetical protein FOZ63_028761 [Perkinsus olseni]KAF4712496.1 hypothetical protein FOZ62_029808 [Perkinsus olseni]